MNLAEGCIIAEHYQLLKQLGQGNFGNVWLAHNMLVDIDVAMKFYGTLDEKGIEDFRNEFKIAYKLRHPNLLNINHFDVYENYPYLVMPYCANGSVNRRIGKMSEQEIWKFILDVSGGLAFLHSQQPPIVHQDIKPDNILITSDGRYVISDFGISRSFRTKMSRTNNNISSSGTIAYMGPERFSEKPIIVLASDIWAFGMTLYELMTGDVLWEGMGGCVQLNGARIPTISGNFSPELANLVTSCLAAETWNRPTATLINSYAMAWLQHKTLPRLPIQNVTTNYTPTPVSAPEPKNVVRIDTVVHHSEVCVPSNRKSKNISHINKSKVYTPQTDTNDHSMLKRALLLAAVIIFGILLITGGTMIISEINEQQDYLSCKTKQDYEQFIKKHPNSSYVEEARYHISSMTNNAPTPQTLMQNVRTENHQQQTEHTNNASQPKTIYITKTIKPQNLEHVVHEVNEVPKKPVISPTPKLTTSSADDQEFYNCVTARDYDNYLRNNPNGKHRTEATQELSSLIKQSAHNNANAIEDISSTKTDAGSQPISRQGSTVKSTINTRLYGGDAGRFMSRPPARSHNGNNYRGNGGARGRDHNSKNSTRGIGGGSSHRHSH